MSFFLGSIGFPSLPVTGESGLSAHANAAFAGNGVAVGTGDGENRLAFQAILQRTTLPSH
jgi:hypothetical protein